MGCSGFGGVFTGLSFSSGGGFSSSSNSAFSRWYKKPNRAKNTKCTVTKENTKIKSKASIPHPAVEESNVNIGKVYKKYIVIIWIKLE